MIKDLIYKKIYETEIINAANAMRRRVRANRIHTCLACIVSQLRRALPVLSRNPHRNDLFMHFIETFDNLFKPEQNLKLQNKFVVDLGPILLLF